MKFLYESYNQGYWRVDLDNMLLFNYHGGYHEINENSPDWLDGILIEAESWHELYLMKKYNPIEGDYTSSEGWIAPDGSFWEGTAHSILAFDICRIKYGLEMEDWAADFLVDHGWIKFTCSTMYNIYLKSNHYDYMTKEQYENLYEWCVYHKKPFPVDAVIRESNLFI